MEVLDSPISFDFEVSAQHCALDADIEAYGGRKAPWNTRRIGENGRKGDGARVKQHERFNHEQEHLDCRSASFQQALFDAIVLVNELISQNAEPAGYGAPPPPYSDALDDLPPEYSMLPALAEAKTFTHKSAPPKAQSKQSPNGSPKSKPASSIDFESTHGFRQHGKKQKAKMAAKKTVPVQSTSGGDGDDDKKDETIESPGGGGGGGSAGGDDGGGDGGGNDDGDGWGEWNASSKKKKSKKKEEEEEEERKRKEEEAAAAGTAATNLSWADDVDGANDDGTWAGFTAAGKKDKKKKNSVRVKSLTWNDCVLIVYLA